MPASDAFVDRSMSVSSILRMNVPSWPRASSQLKSAVRALPTCRWPVGLGAKRTLIITRGASPLELPYTRPRGDPCDPRSARVARSLRSFAAFGAPPLELPYTRPRGDPCDPRSARVARSLRSFAAFGAPSLELPCTRPRGDPCDPRSARVARSLRSFAAFGAPSLELPCRRGSPCLFQKSNRMRGDGFTAADCVEAFVRLPLDAHARRVDAERVGHRDLHRLDVIAQLRRFEDHRHVHVEDVETRGCGKCRGLTQKIDARGSLPPRIRIGEMPSDVAEVACAEHGVGGGVARDVAVGVRDRSAAGGNRHPADDE